ncbi:hypothetical protein [Planctomyces sp. SH-PL14]|uniref:hypothetical protein n=1 Tax=Planctomyces sp. SH-PL14 TaxID=1632864 RepID=UPI00078B49EB|nr:hypothetical protein [Planctomyces sp. SH-PL14]AMV20442.1 hypothetical protein VT03_21265 [Planctomyces sp. SH-PL14]
MSESPYNDRTAGHYWVVFQGQQEVGTWAYINDAEGSGWGWFLPGFGNWFNDDELDSIGEQVIPDPVPGLRQQLEEAREQLNLAASVIEKLPQSQFDCLRNADECSICHVEDGHTADCTLEAWNNRNTTGATP